MKKVLLLLLFLALFYGCETIVCNEPYIQVGKECCLDKDSNGICDSDEEVKDTKSNIVIKETDPKVVEKTEYVCPDGTTVSDKDDCPVEEKAEEEEKLEIPELDKNNEEGTVIEEVRLETACPNAVGGVRVYYKVGTVPSNMIFQLKEVGEEYENILDLKGLYQGDNYFAICDDCFGSQIDHKLEEDKVYIFRIMFNQSRVYDRYEYSNEYLIDTREDSKFMLKMC